MADPPPLSAMAPPHDESREALSRHLRDLLDLAAPNAWLISERLNWSGRWPALLATQRLATPRYSQEFSQVCRSTLPESALLAIYAGRPGAVTRWRTLAPTETDFMGVRMTAFRSGSSLACLIQRKGTGRVTEISLDLN